MEIKEIIGRLSESASIGRMIDAYADFIEADNINAHIRSMTKIVNRIESVGYECKRSHLVEDVIVYCAYRHFNSMGGQVLRRLVTSVEAIAEIRNMSGRIITTMTKGTVYRHVDLWDHTTETGMTSKPRRFTHRPEFDTEGRKINYSPKVNTQEGLPRKRPPRKSVPIKKHMRIEEWLMDRAKHRLFQLPVMDEAPVTTQSQMIKKVKNKDVVDIPDAHHEDIIATCISPGNQSTYGLFTHTNLTVQGSGGIESMIDIQFPDVQLDANDCILRFNRVKDKLIEDKESLSQWHVYNSLIDELNTQTNIMLDSILNTGLRIDDFRYDLGEVMSIAGIDVYRYILSVLGQSLHIGHPAMEDLRILIHRAKEHMETYMLCPERTRVSFKPYIAYNKLARELGLSLVDKTPVILSRAMYKTMHDTFMKAKASNGYIHSLPYVQGDIYTLDACYRVWTSPLDRKTLLIALS
jgi:hypothetical protein